ncbi:MAG TPA: hypothetical protein VK206_02875, partial [Anaerolineales bacterium]|nr:hypothetical protein [Anaerolineales bacterium]
MIIEHSFYEFKSLSRTRHAFLKNESANGGESPTDIVPKGYLPKFADKMKARPENVLFSEPSASLLLFGSHG